MHQNIITKTLRQKALKQDTPGEEGINKIILEHILQYQLINTIQNNNYLPPKIEKPDYENLKQIL